ncbi:MAG TPA: transcription termination factor NusA [Ignavibacteriales bacterium]|nr:transcription termination factor NusA [Ignavibacteriales bacterium]HPD66812.1 transcription termination factor NusA [Ignavibacteriales bacterium]HPP32702.1 transcription termination factor NusA [Ignavibacteriales bacterium]HRR18195.1 transcription termination factor NusA [Ignavibacteriales bacterium]
MNNEIMEYFSLLVKEKGIDRDYLEAVIKDIFETLVKKKFGPNANSDIIVNMEKGGIEIYYEREIVEELEDPVTQISIDEVNELGNEDELEVGDVYLQKIEPHEFGRRLINMARQTLSQKIREIEREIIYRDYSAMIGEIIVGEVYQIMKNGILVNHNRTEVYLPKSEQIPTESYTKGSTIRAVVKKVEKTPKGPQIIISRADNSFLKKLFEIEIPEIYDGLIEIKGIVREPGERAKVAVFSDDNRIDAVGACIGMKGVRISSIVKELNNEYIDVISYSDNPAIYVQRALQPGKVKKVEVDEANKKCYVYADNDQIAVIVGKNAVNIQLAMKLTGYDIDILREAKSFAEFKKDVELIDVKDQLGDDVYVILINNRFDTCLDVLKTPKYELVKTLTELDEEQIDEILQIVRKQLESAN